MAPTRKSKSVNREYLSRYEVFPDKSPGNSRKSKPKKKLTDKLGSQWSKAEIERFYKAYREYGKDWKKVAAAVHNRSAEMVEALYCLNRAYLSLPDGTASVIGLIAMMTDHYNVLGESDDERESNKPSDTPRKAQKRNQARVHLESSKENVQLRSIASSEGCLSLLKREGFNGIFPRACRKRTPRVPVSYSYRKDDNANFIPPTKRVKKSEVDDEDDEHVAAWTLTGTLQKGGCPHASQSPYIRAEHRRSSPLRKYDRMFPQSDTTEAKLHDSSYECRIKDRPGEIELVSGTYARDTGSLMDVDGTGTVEVHQKGKNFYRKKIEVEEMKSNLSDDSGEACSGTKGIIDQNPSLDALLTLANLSTSMLPTSMTESESSVKMKEDRITFEVDDQSSVPETASISHHRDKIKQRGPNKKVLNLVNGSEGTTSRKSTVGRYSAKYDCVVSEPKLQQESTNNSRKRKQKSSGPKVLNAETPPMDSHLRKCSNNEETAKEEKKYLNKGKCGARQTLFRVPVESVTNNDPKVAGIDSVVSTSQVPASNSISLPTKHQSRRKMNLKSALLSTNKNLSACSLENQPNGHSLPQETLKERFSSCISSNLARRWCCFEWFYSPIDYAWFAKREFVEYLNHVSLDHIPRLTRVEWGVIRSSLGKPRRLSERFLLEEREKLKQYRESVRQHYTQLRLGTREGLATDLAPPLSVGQRVIAIHPKTREVYDGKVLTVDHDRCRVQFDSLDLGVEFVMDIDCMPINPLENMPETLKRQNLAFDKTSLRPRGSQGNGNLELGGSMVFTSSGCLENAMGPVNMLATPIKVDAKHSALHGKPAVSNVSAHQAAYCQPLTMAHIQVRETDIQVMSELSHALDKKEALLTELRNTNNDISEILNGERCLKGSEHFKEHVSTLLVQIKEASGRACGYQLLINRFGCNFSFFFDFVYSSLTTSDLRFFFLQASSALHNLRQHNTYPAKPLLPWQKPPTDLDFFSGFTSSTLDSSLITPEVGSVVGDIVNGSRLKAHAMVDAAIKAVSSMKEDEEAFMRIGEALHSLDKKQFTSDISMPTIKLPEHNQVNGSISITPKPMPNGSISRKNEEQVPSELIKSCVATLLMIQRCTERQFPPADVAQVIDSAIATLHPCCPQNLTLYREIQMCMGKIKTQILALIPTLV